MVDDDQKLLDSFERIYLALDQEILNLEATRAIYVERMRQWENEIKAYTRIIEEISLPARLILEHILELKHKSGQMAVEGESLTQGYSAINGVTVEEFGLIRISTGTIELSWRDENYNYLFYPDKVELRTVDEKAMIRFFFSHHFSRQHIKKLIEIADSPKLSYIHPVLKKY